MASRRSFLEAGLAAGGGALLGFGLPRALAARASRSDEAVRHQNAASGDVESALNVREARFGARGDGRRDDSEAIQKAIDAASLAGGGVVYLPKGDYPAAVELRSNVHLSCAPGTVIRAAGPASPIRIVGDNASVRYAVVSGQLSSSTRDVRSSHCIDVRGSNILIENVTSGASRHDSLYVRSREGGLTVRNCEFKPTARNTVSIVRGHDILFENCRFEQAQLHSSGGFNGLYLYDIEPEGANEVYGVTHVRCTFRNGLGDGTGGVILSAEGNRGTGDNRVAFIGCTFLKGPRVDTIIRLRGGAVYHGLTLLHSRFEGFVFTTAGELVTLSRSALVGNEHRSARFAYGVRLDDVALVDHRGGGWGGLVRSARTAIIAARPAPP